VRILLDVDTGVDDALALAFAVRHPEIELEGVITAAGNVGLASTTRNTLRVLDLLGASNVPVAMGAPAPLSGVLREASHVHGSDGLGGAQLPAPTRAALPDGIRLLIDLVQRSPDAITVVCTGPFTNLAVAAKREPSIIASVREVVVMGGAVRVPGNVTPTAEFNVYADPEAAAIVFDLPWEITMVGLDVTTRVQLTRAERDALVDDGTPEAVLVREATRHLFDTRGVDAMSLHDPLAVAVAFDPSLVTSVQRQVLVETRGEHTLGQTVVDLRPGAGAFPPTRVCLDVDAERAKALFLEILGLRSRHPAPVELRRE
jgi:inosine-uridine nucleoside N-ribohydrolase